MALLIAKLRLVPWFGSPKNFDIAPPMCQSATNKEPMGCDA